MSATQIFTGILAIETCCSCGVVFGMPSDVQKMRLADHKSFWCPNGHSQHYTGKSEAERLNDQLKQKEQSLEYYRNANSNLHDQLTQKNHVIRAVKGAKTRILNRVKNGVCPCCNRSFADLQKHFASKHPEMLKPAV